MLILRFNISWCYRVLLCSESHRNWCFNSWYGH